MNLMRILGFILVLLAPQWAHAQADDGALRGLIAGFAQSKNFKETEDIVRKLAATGDARLAAVLGALSDGNVAFRKADNAVFILREQGGKTSLLDVLTAQPAGEGAAAEFTKIRVNNGLRRAIREVMATLTLGSPKASVRLTAANTMFAAPDPSAIEALDAAIAAEKDAAVKLAMQQARAYQAARAGLEWGITRVVNGQSCASSFSLTGFSISVTCTATTPLTVAEENKVVQFYELVATAEFGAAGSPDYAYRRLSVMVEKP